MIQTELIEKGLAQADPSSRLTMESLCTGMLGWLVVILSTCSSGQFAATRTSLASPREHAARVSLWPKTSFPVVIPCFICLDMSNQPSPQLFLGA